MARRELPVIACSLDGEGQAARAEEFRDLFARALVSREPVARGARLRFRLDAQAQVRDLFTREQACCPFWEITIRLEPDAVVAEIAGPTEATPLLDGLLGTR